MFRVTRTIHPVGQGLFCTEKFYRNKDKLVNVVYDCGSFDKSALSKKIKEAFNNNDVIDVMFISHLHYDHISGLNELSQRYHIRSVVMPQLPPNLQIESLAYNCVYAPQEGVEANQIVSRLLFGDNEDDFHRVFVERSENIEGLLNEEDIKISALGKQATLKSSKIIVTLNNDSPIWEYVPYNMILDSDAETLVNELSKEPMFAFCFNAGNINVESFLKIIKKEEGRKKCAEIYKKVIQDYNANEYSMPVYSGPIMKAPMSVNCFIDYNSDEVCDKLSHVHCFKHCHSHSHVCCDMDCCAPYPFCGSLANCLYTGDFNANPKKSFYNSMVDFYHKCNCWERIKMIQVPHHGSKYNHNTDLYRGRCWAIISCGLDNHFGHPHSECVADIVATGCHCSVVNEKCYLGLPFSTF